MFSETVRMHDFGQFCILIMYDQRGLSGDTSHYTDPDKIFDQLTLEKETIHEIQW